MPIVCYEKAYNFQQNLTICRTQNDFWWQKGEDHLLLRGKMNFMQPFWERNEEFEKKS
jgi:hypothetical protein